MKRVTANLVVGTRRLESPSTLLSRRTNELLVGEGLLTLRRTSRQINNKKKLESSTREGVACGVNIFSRFVYYSGAADNVIIPLHSFSPVFAGNDCSINLKARMDEDKLRT